MFKNKQNDSNKNIFSLPSIILDFLQNDEIVTNKNRKIENTEIIDELHNSDQLSKISSSALTKENINFLLGGINCLELTAVKDQHFHLPPASEPPRSSQPIFRKINYYVSTSYESILQKKILDQEDPIKMAVIFGTAGSGKTMLAENYLERMQNKHPEYLVFRLMAETNAQWEFSLQTWAEALYPPLHGLLRAEKNTEKQKRLIIQAIQNALLEKPWCILVDNWDIKSSPSMSEIDQLFSVNHGILLITTQACPPTKKAYSLDLSQGFSPTESKELLLKVMDLKQELGIAWEALGSINELNELILTASYLPLAIVLAGSYLLWENKNRLDQHKSYFTFNNYKALLNSKIALLVEEFDKQLGDKGDVPRDATREEFVRIKTQEMAVDLSLQKAINNKPDQPNVLLWLLLCFCSFLASDKIPQQLLKDYLFQLLPKSSVTLEDQVNNIIETSTHYSLLQFESNHSSVDGLFSIHIHRIIQKVLRDNYWEKLIQSCDLKNFSEKLSEQVLYFIMCKAIAIVLGPALKEESYTLIRAYSIHIESMLKTFIFSTEIAKNDNVSIYTTIIVHSGLAVTKHLLGEYKAAETLYRTIIDKQKDFFKSDSHYSISESQISLAGILCYLGRYEEAKELCENALKIMETHYDKISLDDLVAFLSNFSIVQHKLGDNKKAEILCREALKATIKKYGTILHIKVADAKHNLATTLKEQEKYEEIASLYREVLEITIEHYKTKDHIRVADTQQNLANTLRYLEKYEEAELLCREALTTTIKHYQNESHVSVADTQQNLAIILERRGKYREAYEFCQKSLDTKIAYYGTTAPGAMADIKSAMVTILISLNLYERAEKLARDALMSAINFYKTNAHIKILTIQKDLADALVKLNRLEEAESLYREMLKIKNNYYKMSEKITIARIQEDFAEVLETCENYEEAESLYREALEIRIFYYGLKTDITIANTKQNLAILLRKKGEYNKAINLYREAISVATSHYGSINHVDIASMQQNFAITLAMVKEYNDAEFLLRRALETKISHYKTELNIEVAVVQNNLARILTLAGKNEEALFIAQNSGSTFTQLKADKQYLDANEQVKQLINDNQINNSSQKQMNTDFEYIDLFSLYKSSDVSQVMRRAAGQNQTSHLAALLEEYPQFIDEIDQNPQQGWTALHWAVQKESYQCVIELLNRNARYDIIDKLKNSQTAVDLCLKRNSIKIIDTFTKHITKKYVKHNDHEIEKAFRRAASMGDLPAIKLLSISININSIGPESGKTALHIATEKKQFLIVEYLINSGACEDIIDKTGKKAIDYAYNDQALMNLFSSINIEKNVNQFTK